MAGIYNAIAGWTWLWAYFFVVLSVFLLLSAKMSSRKSADDMETHAEVDGEDGAPVAGRKIAEQGARIAGFLSALCGIVKFVIDIGIWLGRLPHQL